MKCFGVILLLFIIQSVAADSLSSSSYLTSLFSGVDSSNYQRFLKGGNVRNVA